MSLQSVTAIVVTYRTGWWLKDCLHALAGDPAISRVIVIDNGNPPDDAAWIARFAARRLDVTVIRPGENLGFGRAANLGAGAAGSADWLAFVNPDAVVKRGAVSALLAAASGALRPVLVGGRIFGLDGREQRGCRRRELNWATATGLKRWTLETTPPPDGPVSVDCVSGAFFAMPRQDFEALGGFDEGYFLHVEDVDLCRRVRIAGGAVIYQPAAGALHAGATSDVPSATVQAYKAESLVRYFRKFADGPADRLLNALLLPLLGWHVRRKAR